MILEILDICGFTPQRSISLLNILAFCQSAILGLRKLTRRQHGNEHGYPLVSQDLSSRKIPL